MAYDLAIKETKDNRDKYVSLAEGAEYSGYSQDYLRFRIRQGKLRGAKIGRNWLTAKEWLDEYLEKVAEYKEGIANPEKKVLVQEITQAAIEPQVAAEQASVLAAVAENADDSEPQVDVEPEIIAEPPAEEQEKEEEPARPVSILPSLSELIAQAAAVLQPQAEAENAVVQSVAPAEVATEMETEKPVQVRHSPSAEAILAEFNKPVVINLNWLKYALALFFFCGVLGFAVGFAYPYLEPGLENAKSNIVSKSQELLRDILEPFFPEQFAASFGVIYQDPADNSPTPFEQNVVSLSVKLLERQNEKIQQLQQQMRGLQAGQEGFWPEGNDTTGSQPKVEGGSAW